MIQIHRSKYLELLLDLQQRSLKQRKRLWTVFELRNGHLSESHPEK